MIIGASILDLSKRFMFYFHYWQAKANINLKLLYSDTDSFICAIKTNDVYADLQKMNDGFDFSNYPNNHFLFSKVNKKVVLKIKDKAAKKIIEEFIAGLLAEICRLVLKKKHLPVSPESFLGF